MGALSISGSCDEQDVLVLSNTYHYCVYEAYSKIVVETWILNTVWQILALCLAVWVTATHFRGLQQQSRGWSAGDCFGVLIKTHVLYFSA